MKIHSNRFRFLNGFLTTIMRASGLLLFIQLIAGCSNQSPDITIELYCFSAMRDVMEERILPAFKELQKSNDNLNVEIHTRYGGSTMLTNHLITRENIDIAILASEIDALRLYNHGVLSEASWLKSPFEGTLAYTPILILYNPAELDSITDFDDLAQQNTQLIMCNSNFSGLGQWTVLALYGAFKYSTRDEHLAILRMRQIWKQVNLKPASAILGRQQYINGRGNTIITYESEIINPSDGRVMGGTVVVPKWTIMCEPKALKIDQQRSPEKEESVSDFMAFLWGNEAQMAFVEYGFRSLDDRLYINNERFNDLHMIFTLDSLGGASQAKYQILEGVWTEKVKSFTE
ncbi:MAG: substrate-binding domain-containing protein [Candidatus Neomarinimicrobiota bacterium]